MRSAATSILLGSSNRAESDHCAASLSRRRSTPADRPSLLILSMLSSSGLTARSRTALERSARSPMNARCALDMGTATISGVRLP